MKRKYVTSIEELNNLSRAEKNRLKKVTEQFRFRANDYYLSLINWDDPNDPLRRTIIPHESELEVWGRPDASDEHAYTVLPGLEHKYASTVLLLVSNMCEGICRYCFRKRVFTLGNTERLEDLSGAVEYIRQHPEVTNVLLTGGDPMRLPTSRLEDIIKKLREIEHVGIIRIGSRITAYNPYRITENPDFLQMVKTYSTPARRIYMMSHFIHPRELTTQAIKAINALLENGVIVANQSPIINGINDDPGTMAELLNKLSIVGAAPYYIFQCRPAYGNKAFSVPIETAYDVIEDAKSMISGLAKRVRYVMSHSSGKIEIIGKTDDEIIMRYHRAADEFDAGRVMTFDRNPQAKWLEDYLGTGQQNDWLYIDQAKIS